VELLLRAELGEAERFGPASAGLSLPARTAGSRAATEAILSVAVS
jgi:hypothetical protein